VQLLHRRDAQPEVQNRVLGILERETQRVGAILSDFLDFARSEGPPGVVLALPRVIEDVRASWEMDPRTSGLRLIVPEPPRVNLHSDPMGMHRMLLNLLSNARKAVEGVEQPEVRLVTSEAQGRIRIAVEDNGCGMTPEQLERLFVPFAGSFEEGSGLGMNLVYKFIEAMGWEIEVQSRAGRGTLVQIHLPRWLPEEPLAPPRDQA
jgi:two-component system sensor histidine kinase PilS (NtrC family)